MSIKRFFGATTRDALRMVRDALGPDGVILSNRAVDGGVEILALGAEDIAALVPTAGPAAMRSATKNGTRFEDIGNSEGSIGQPAQRIVHAPGREDSANAVERMVKMAEKIEHVEKKAQVMPQTREKIAGQEEREDFSPAFSNPPRFKFPAFDERMPEQQPQHISSWNIPSQAGGTAQTRESLSSSIRDTRRMRESINRPATGEFAAGNVAKNVADTVINNTGFHQPEEDNEPEIPLKLMTSPKREAGGGQEAEEAAGAKKGRATATARKTAKPQHGARKAAPEAVTQPAFDSRRLADEVAASVLREIKSMRGTLEHQLATLTWNEQHRRDPSRGHALGQLLSAGFSASLAHELLEQLPGGLEEQRATEWVKSVLKANLQTIPGENEILEQGGVYALVGPTGVGKTTTTAKLAARCVVRHGADKLALLTTDGYRIGGHEQLRIYGKILGVTVYAVKDQQDLSLALAELRGKHMVLIDTVGMGQRDKMVAEQVAMLTGCGTEVKRLLLLNAASSGDTLNEVVSAYEGGGLAGAIITKLDEAATTGCVLDTIIRHQLRLYYTATGQRVPEDLHVGNAGRLIDGAFNNLPAASPFSVPEDMFPLLMAGSKGRAGRLAGIGMNGGGLG